MNCYELKEVINLTQVFSWSDISLGPAVRRAAEGKIESPERSAVSGAAAPVVRVNVNIFIFHTVKKNNRNKADSKQCI